MKFICIKCYRQFNRIKSYNISGDNRNHTKISLNCTNCGSLDTIHFLKDIKIHWNYVYVILSNEYHYNNVNWSKIVNISAESRDIKNATLIEIYNSA